MAIPFKVVSSWTGRNMIEEGFRGTVWKLKVSVKA